MKICCGSLFAAFGSRAILSLVTCALGSPVMAVSSMPGRALRGLVQIIAAVSPSSATISLPLQIVTTDLPVSERDQTA